MQASEEDDDAMFDMEAAGRKFSDVAIESLDNGLVVMFNYVKKLTADDDAFKSFYFDFLHVFESTLLPVYATGHVQVLDLASIFRNELETVF